MTGVQTCALPICECLAYLSGLDWRLSMPHLKGLSEFFNRLELAGKVPAGKLVFLGAA